MPKLFSIVGQTASIIISVVASLITLLYTFFILQDYEFLTDNWIRIFPKKNRPFWSELMQDVERELNNYIRGQGLVSLCLGILFGIGLTIIDFPMAIALGIMMGLMNLVPYLHTLAPVSYTHLDVYKRQTMHTIGNSLIYKTFDRGLTIQDRVICMDVKVYIIIHLFIIFEA